ncbi:MAG: A/G-specific adenine glycosylase [Bacteroidetes bacterium GWC2_33_15]|nr:MAG: A/G-specific adenine glycosylase [Bacteroidetes bacterium GWA2_33_15]OFX51701.1 MAG: A/G-specific adenine glycosylase [Bacteroidetes bacterium GWC2_33_15]OFX66238.1 MAG: A/G-specific adenine glycosylase [Bacteroidetes bacterium GWB2_32_14]OFX67001.1 MAG: A/G-specific adenine glycosylase [Bacteroidetes bacterium GWD2_33_33]HAN17702.1 A/G-specific adenine glycosylase [Bacteroidales bacterium]
MHDINKALINWYFQNKRELPWRNTTDPYIVWVSEIILQQTRVDQGIGYFYRFIKKYPDIKTLAKAPIDDVLKLWQGLGYYSRARNMHFTANTILNNYSGKFPAQFGEIKKLKGIGEYTAAAIASFCFNEPIPVVDGNVYRFIARFFGVFESTQSASGKKIFLDKCKLIIDTENPGIFNQAIMEFGALQCKAKNPDCTLCPFRHTCYALLNNCIEQLPSKKNKIKTSNRHFNYLFIQYNDKIFLEQRKKDDIWKLLYQFPLIETVEQLKAEEIAKHKIWKKMFEGAEFEIQNISKLYKHQLSHQKIFARFYKIKIDKISPCFLKKYLVVNKQDINKYGIPRLIDKYLNDIKM